MTQLTDFLWTDKPEPHAVRRKLILQKYPQIEKLYRKDPLSAVFCFGTMVIQLVSAYIISVYEPNWWFLTAFTFAIGSIWAHSITLAGHELSHSVWLPKIWQNELLGVVSNLATGFPAFATFKRYHLEHHTSQGVDGIDVDIPTNIEGTYINRVWSKFIFCLMQPFAYSLRPMIINPKPMSGLEAINYVVVVAGNVCVWYFLGGQALFYLMMSTVMGTSLHPIAGHFIAEHYVFKQGQETYSYYGILNKVTYNVGFHNEHHDFPRIPGRLLPQVTKIAPEFYESLQSYNSWFGVIVDFIFTDNISCFSRIKRAKRGNIADINVAVEELKVSMAKWEAEQGPAYKTGEKRNAALAAVETKAEATTDVGSTTDDASMTSDQEEVAKAAAGAPPASGPRRRKSSSGAVAAH